MEEEEEEEEEEGEDLGSSEQRELRIGLPRHVCVCVSSPFLSV
jgi:hypothetical protein